MRHLSVWTSFVHSDKPWQQYIPDVAAAEALFHVSTEDIIIYSGPGLH